MSARRSKSRQEKARRKASASSQSGKLAQKVSLELVNATDAALIHEAVITVLSQVGVMVEHKPSRDMLVRQHGCQQGSDEYISPAARTWLIRLFQPFPTRSCFTI